MNKIISGKVREVYSVNENELLIVTTDRVSSFDVILGNEIPDKGRLLNDISNFWFEYTKDIVPNHIISTSLIDMPDEIKLNSDAYKGRTVLAKKLKMLPYEFIVRGYMFGNMWKSYSNGEEFCGQKIEGKYELAQRLEKPIITPSVKNHEGHDEYISMEKLIEGLGEEIVSKIKDICMRLYSKCYDYAYKKGIIIADTKFEFGINNDGEIVLGDEIFTPDSSRFWKLDKYKVGSSPISYDKQFVRDWLIKNNLNGTEPGPKLPENIIEATKNLYIECRNRLVGDSDLK